MFYFVKTPKIIQWLLPQYQWKISTNQKSVFLTFDDGPVPEATPFVLDMLAQYQAKATFFCVGDNVRKHPDIYAQIQEAGHSVGNHTYNHYNGSKTPFQAYLDNVAACAQYVDSDLFRPPYGRLTRAQTKALSQHYRIIMWDVLSADFDPKVSPEQCLHNMKRHIRPGAIVLMHDSVKFMEKITYALPHLLEFLTSEGYKCERL